MSDEIVDYNEDDYIIAVAKAMGLPEDKYRKLTLDIQLEEAGKVLKPPPLPSKD